MRTAAILLASMFVIALWPTATAQGPSEEVQERFYDKHGRLIAERGLVEGSDGLEFMRQYWLVPVEKEAKPDHAGGPKGGGGGGDTGSDPGTDCESDKYVLAGWHWAAPYSASASSYASVLDASAQTWEDAAGVDIFAGITAGSAATAGVQDFVNQIDFVPLGSSSTIAVTTTWYYTSTGVAVESDAQYNTAFAWATDGSPDAMDVQAIATHELGHTFGLTHPNGNPRQISCLTMYAYGSEGSTIERTLGDGDILGIQALYA